jgi:hypothetical protein
MVVDGRLVKVDGQLSMVNSLQVLDYGPWTMTKFYHHPSVLPGPHSSGVQGYGFWK